MKSYNWYFTAHACIQIFFLTRTEVTPKSNSVVFISLFDFTYFVPTLLIFGLLKNKKTWKIKGIWFSIFFFFVYFLFQYKWLAMHGENMDNKEYYRSLGSSCFLDTIISLLCLEQVLIRVEN